jgi:alditol oxidase
MKSIEVDVESKTVRIEPGVTFGELSDVLDAKGMALECLPSHVDINVVGAIITGSHSGGTTIKSFSSYVTAIEIVDVHGKMTRHVRGHTENFCEYLHHFGLLGVVTAVEMEICKAY